MDRELSPQDAKELIALCQAGRLFAVEQWIRTGRSLQVPAELKKTPLGIAVASGFHSLVELLLRHQETEAAKNQALRDAVQTRRRDLIELAVGCGADVKSVSFLDVLLTGDRQIVTFFLESGADPIAGHPFAHAFHELRAKTVLGSYLDCKRSRPDLTADLQGQIDMALRQFCHDGNLKWVSLLMWAGADPRSNGPSLEYIDDPDMFTTAFYEACTSGSVEIVKRLRPDPKRDDLSMLLERAAFRAHPALIAYLLDLGANPNDKADGGSGALDGCIRRLGWEDFDRILHRYGPNHKTSAYKVSGTREAIRLLVSRGARWTPDSYLLSEARRIFSKIDADVTVEFAGVLLNHRACEGALVHKFIGTPAMKEHLAHCERQLARIGLVKDGRRLQTRGAVTGRWRTAQRRVEEPKPSSSPMPPVYVSSRYDRKKLYEEVWAEPTQKVATRYGVSDVALSKACRQLNIPKPPRGYWAKKAAGQSVPRRPKLPSVSGARAQQAPTAVLPTDG